MSGVFFFRLLGYHSIREEALLQAVYQALQWGCALGMCHPENHWHQSTSGNANTAPDPRHWGKPRNTQTFVYTQYTASFWQTTCDKSHQTQTAVSLHNIPPLFCYHGTHMAIFDQESKVSSACLSLLNDLIFLHHSGIGRNSPEAEQPFQDELVSIQSSETLH